MICRTLTAPRVTLASRRLDTTARSPYAFDARVAKWLYCMWGLHCAGA